MIRPPDQLVFSGGGLRCFWQGGFISVVARHMEIAPKRLTGVSGGALAGAAFLSGRSRRLLDTMCAVFERQDSNLDLFHEGDDGITPHQSLYREVVESVLDAEAARRVAQGAQYQIQIAHPPDHGSPTLSGTAMAMAYEAELKIVNSPHFDWAEKMGLTRTLVNANQAAREGKLCDLVCAAAVIPPVFEPPKWDGRPVIDGGMADQAPMPEPDRGDTLVLLTRRYRNLPDVAGRRYVMPADETEADKIDFTDPAKLRDTWAQGERDARQWLDRVGRG
ncbi:patatin-like phospholipase family protein [Psychromarinibacter sp. C21-152]|uniref:Patatin-like phospholipase family protein n=1 Tax=Psychromarinibacter sediminicola TaxID=3033385 RepID=A0AAE3T849_9RHOB|nr:patatin-like phospholipase family protein [Psychromarinibacter sediminicola]MDF0601025.1 patatin-like phospholipase family protein [Psychromarinibacter sediminicola]